MAALGVHTFVFAPEWHAGTAESVLPHLKELGVRLIEIPLLRPDDVDVEAAQRVAATYDIELTCSLGLPDHLDIVARPDDAVSFLQVALDVTRRLGARCLSGVTYGTIGKVSGAAPTQAEKDAVVRLLERVGGEARERGLRLGVEPCNRYETHLMNTAADAVELIERSGSDSVFIHLDTYHMNIEEAGMADAIATAGDLLGYIHLSESNRGVPGSGTLDWEGVMRGLAAVGFEGPAVLESFNYMHPDIARALAVWKPVAERPADVTEKGLPFLSAAAERAGVRL